MKVALLLLALVTLPAPARAGGDWNDGQIGWRKYQDGLDAAKKDKKPICLVFYTGWCPHCANYSGVFHDPRIVERAKRLVMIRVDRDAEQELSQKYAPDGDYIPRTMFLTSAGALETSIHAPREKYQYFYDEHDPTSVLAGMDEALKKLR